MVDCYEVDATIVLPEEWPDAGVLSGREAIRTFYAGFEESWSQGSRVEPLAFDERGALVTVPVASSVVGKAAGVGLDFAYTMIFTVPESLIAKVEFQLGHGAAAEDPGSAPKRPTGPERPRWLREERYCTAGLAPGSSSPTGLSSRRG